MLVMIVIVLVMVAIALVGWLKILRLVCLRCDCNGLLHRGCPQHGWPAAEPLGAWTSNEIEWLIALYLEVERYDAAWFESYLGDVNVSMTQRNYAAMTRVFGPTMAPRPATEAHVIDPLPFRSGGFCGFDPHSLPVTRVQKQRPNPWGGITLKEYADALNAVSRAITDADINGMETRGERR